MITSGQITRWMLIPYEIELLKRDYKRYSNLDRDCFEKLSSITFKILKLQALGVYFRNQYYLTR